MNHELWLWANVDSPVSRQELPGIVCKLRSLPGDHTITAVVCSVQAAIPAELAAAYAQFLTRLRRLFGAQGYFVWAALAPKTSAGQPGLLYEGHDYAAVGAAADAVLLMTYEWGYTYHQCCY